MRTILIIFTATFLAVAAAGCGGERRFDAQGFVDAANAEGAGFELGAPLSSNDPEHTIYALELRVGGVDAPAPAGAEVPEHAGGGSVTVAADEDEARAEYAECESAASLLCYRAANVAVVLEPELPLADRARIDSAISSLASE